MKNDIIKLDNFIDRKTVNSAYLDLRHNFYWTVVSDKPGSNIKKAAFGRGYEHEDLVRALENYSHGFVF